MKQISAAAYLLVVCFLLSCSGRRHHNINITISESDNGIYKVMAEYDERKDRQLERCLNDQLVRNGSMSFINTRIDGDITLDDKTTFYIKKEPGFLKIKFDKDKNTTASFHEMKAFAEELKLALQK